MSSSTAIRWGILGTAHIAKSAFLPALRTAGGGVPYAVAGRDTERTRQYAHENGIEHARTGYDAILQDDAIDAVYIPLPNTLHAEWTIRAMEAGKAVLCEKPLGATLADVERIVAAASARDALLWEAFVYPWRAQTQELDALLEEGRIGEVRAIEAGFHFKLGPYPDNIRLNPDLGGGALLDVGCYPVSFARYVFRADASGAMARASWAGSGIDVEMDGVLEFPGERRLIFSCGIRRPGGTFSRILGTEGEIRLSNPYHPRSGDSLTVLRADGLEEDRSTNNEGPTFTETIRHIHRVLHGEEQPHRIAQSEALGNAVALDLIVRSARSGCFEAL